MSIKPIPDGYRSVNAYLIVSDADQVLDFLRTSRTCPARKCSAVSTR